ncbi:PucR family transcriptional regulator [Allosalinactinospora lopnorensis]|uniref:PucR family transcriptional regulator n=1 Tax=Allosalinactinospora lopnorensis TaxID=1352348 RepID=UPI000623FFA6|nr:PucR family transcriptional regulator [Allosalinactinospora lopnorensis]
MQISELLAIPRLHLRFLSGAEHAHRRIRWAYTTDLLEPKRYLSGGELVLTGMMWRNAPEDSERFVRSLDEAGVACLAAGAALGEIPPDLIAACQRYDMPLIEVPAETSFGVVTEEVVRLLTRRRFSSIAETRDRHRRLMAEVAAGADFPEVFAGAAEEAGISAWVISSTGRLVASTGQEPQAAGRERLAFRALGWTSFPRSTELPASEEAGTRTVTVLPVQTRESHPLAGWLLVCASDHASWSDETHEAVAEIVSMAVLARSRAEERSLSDARHAEGLSRLLATQRFDEVAALLHVAGQADTGEGDRQGQHIAVSATLLPEPRLPDLARRIVAELVADWSGSVVTGENDALAIIPVPGTGEAGTRAAERLYAGLARDARVLEGGLVDYRLAVGISSTARDLPDLRGAAVEAQHARRLAELRGGRSRVIAGVEIDSHELLLASVPEEVRSSYRERLLGPLLAYDRDHRSDLVRTLERFLQHSGSWQRCAAAMHVHVNTLRYRIGRVEELTGRDLSNLEHRVDLFLALKLRS